MMGIEKMRDNLRNLKGDISSIRHNLERIEAKVELIEREILKPESPEQEFKREFPGTKVDKELLRLVGTQPITTLEQEKREIRGAVFERFDA